MLRNRKPTARERRRNQLSKGQIQGRPYEQDYIEFVDELNLRGLTEAAMLRLILRERYDRVRMQRNLKSGKTLVDNTPEQHWLMELFRPIDDKFTAVERRVTQISESVIQGLKALATKIDTGAQTTTQIRQLKVVREHVEDLVTKVDDVESTLIHAKTDILKVLVPLYALLRELFAQNNSILQLVLRYTVEPALSGQETEEAAIQIRQEYRQDGLTQLNQIEEALMVSEKLISMVALQPVSEEGEPPL